MARARRRRNLDDPTLGRQRHDRTVGRQPAGLHDAKRRRAGACRRQPGAGEVLTRKRAGSRTRSCIRGVAHALLGEHARATDDLTTAVDKGLAAGAAEEVYLAQAELALLAVKQGAWAEAAQRARAAQALVDETGLGDYASSAIVHVVTARVALHEARPEDARAAITRAHRLRPLLDHGIPWLTIQVGLELTRAHLTLAEAAAAGTILTETERVLELRPDMGSLVDEARELREHVAATDGSAGAWAMSLTAAELRLLPYLATHLTFPEIGSRLFISRTTVKTEAVSLYRKLGASSRSQAIERADRGRAPGKLGLPAPDYASRKDDAQTDHGRSNKEPVTFEECEQHLSCGPAIGPRGYCDARSSRKRS